MYKVTPLLADPRPERPLTVCARPRTHPGLLEDVPRTLFSSQGVLVFCQHVSESGNCCMFPATGPSVPATGPCVSSPAGGAELLALSAKGRLMICHLDPHAEAPQPSRVTSAKAGQKIKQLLSGIGTVSER